METMLVGSFVVNIFITGDLDYLKLEHLNRGRWYIFITGALEKILGTIRSL